MRFWQRALEDRDHIALVTAGGGHVTAGELLDRANAMVHAGRARGMTTGSRVATVLPNGPEFLATHLAATQAGWYLVPVNYHLVSSEIAHILRDSGATMLVGHERFGDAIVAATADAPEVVTRLAVGSIDGFDLFAEALDCASSKAPDERTAGAIMHYTSGTTGRPKGVERPLPGTSPDDVSDPFADLLGLLGIESSSQDVHLCGSPLYHTAVLAFAVAALHEGQSVVLMERWTADDMLTAIERYRITNTHMVPTQFNRLLQLPRVRRESSDVSSLRYVVHGAAPCSIDTKRQMIDWWGPVIYEYYGTTEGGGTVVDSADWISHAGTVGRPWPGADLKILDDEGVELGPGERGAVYIKLGENAFAYHDDDDKTAANRRGEYFTVGDIGEIDEQGYLFLRDRSADLIIAGGVNIYPVEIEHALLLHPAVADVGVIGVPDPDLGERVLAVVEPMADQPPGPALDEALRVHCESHLARFKVPRQFAFVAELPRDPSGKLFKRRLRDEYASAAPPSSDHAGE